MNQDALRSYERRDLVLELSYWLEARERVHEMVRNEQTCCAFLVFDRHEVGDEIRLTITAPETAREAADSLFNQFLAKASAESSCACASTASAVTIPSKAPPGTKAAGVTAVTLSTGAVACGVCCVLPFALPATLLASTGTLLAWFVKMHVWVTVLAILSVVGAWGWIAWQSRRTRRRPATSTLFMMAAATVLLTVAVLWPLIERPLIQALRA
ncbi:MAG: hypothetical protein WAV72_13885 [Bradyrhizobium sp.]